MLSFGLVALVADQTAKELICGGQLLPENADHNCCESVSCLNINPDMDAACKLEGGTQPVMVGAMNIA